MSGSAKRGKASRDRRGFYWTFDLGISMMFVVISENKYSDFGGPIVKGVRPFLN